MATCADAVCCCYNLTSNLTRVIQTDLLAVLCVASVTSQLLCDVSSTYVATADGQTLPSSLFARSGHVFVCLRLIVRKRA